MEDMPAVSSSLEKIPQNASISLALRAETIRHPDKRSKLENDATCGLTRRLQRGHFLLPLKEMIDNIPGGSIIFQADR